MARLTGQEVIAALKKAGFEVLRVIWSLHKRHESKTRRNFSHLNIQPFEICLEGLYVLLRLLFGGLLVMSKIRGQVFYSLRIRIPLGVATVVVPIRSSNL